MQRVLESFRTRLPRVKAAFPWLLGLSVVAGGCATAPTPVTNPSAVAAPAAEASEPAPWVDVEPGAYFHFIRGHQHELNREYDRALPEYLAALKYAPDDQEILSRVASLYLKNGDLGKAIETAEIALEKYPDNTHLLLFLSKLYLREGDNDRAETAYRRLIAQNPDDTKSYYLLVLSYIRQERFEDARALLKTVRKRDSKSALPVYYESRIARAQGNIRRATRLLKKAIQKEPGFEAAYLDLATLYEAQGKPKAAQDLYETVVNDINPLSPFARDRLIQMYLSDGDLDKVLVHYNALLAFNPRNPTLLTRKALILADQGKLTEAIDTIGRVLVLLPSDIRTLEMRANLYEKAERFEDARATYRRILELDPDNVQAHVRLGYIANQLNDTADREEIVAAAEALLEDDPGNMTLYLFVSWGHLRAKRYEEAVDVLERALTHDPENMEAHFSLGATFYELKRYDDMVREMRWVVERNPQHAYALNFLGYSFAERGVNLDEAIELVQRALKIKPDDGLFLDSLAWAYYQQGKYKQALKVQKKAVGMGAEIDGVLHDHLGSIYLALGQRNKARENWLKALVDDPENDELKDRFREAGFGDPDTLDEVVKARQQLLEQPADDAMSFETVPAAP